LSDERLKPVIVPVFLPFQGCRGRCVFCEQQAITSRSAEPLKPEKIEETLRDAFAKRKHHMGRETIVAFYGGTFTNLSLSLMEKILDTTVPFRKQGLFSSIRVSTRPDALETEKLETMKLYGVDTVELGAQSMDDNVLETILRGHRARDTAEGVAKLKGLGFKVGVQLMVGLPGDSPRGFMATVEKVIGLRPSMVRLYPTVVIEGTRLEQWYRDGRYMPLELDRAVELCADACRCFEKEGIDVIRIGLVGSPTLIPGKQLIDGPWHPCFGFLVRASMHLERILSSLPRLSGKVERVRIRAPAREVPLVRGFRNQGLVKLNAALGTEVAEVSADESLCAGTIGIDAL